MVLNATFTALAPNGTPMPSMQDVPCRAQDATNTQRVSDSAGVETEVYVPRDVLPTPVPDIGQMNLVQLHDHTYVVMYGLRDMGGRGVLYKMGLRNIQSPASGGA